MTVKEINTTEYTCDNPTCGRVQTGQLGEDVFGILGSVFEHTRSGGAGSEYFACSQKCITGAAKWAIAEGWRGNQ